MASRDRVILPPRSTRWILVVMGLTPVVPLVGLGFGPGFVVLSTIAVVGGLAVRRVVGRRGVWATDRDLLIGNADRIVRVPLRGARIVVDDVEWTTIGTDVGELDGSLRRARRTVFVVPPHPDDPRVAIEAATGLPADRMRRLVVDLEATIADAA